MSWEEAQAYAEWAGKRLPTLPELAAAGRGAAGRAFPYDGDDWRGAVHGRAPRAGIAEDLVEGYLASSAPVRSMPEAASAAGVHHLLGNVREWTENLGVVLEAGQLVPQFETRHHYGSDWAARERGTTLDSSAISSLGRSGASLTIGFRCARSLDSHQ